MKELYPVRGKILVKPDPKKRKVGRIVIPNEYVQDVYSAEVVRVGGPTYDPKGRVVYGDVFPGDRVLFRKWEGVELPVPWEDFMILKFRDVVAIISEGVHAEYKRYPDLDDESDVGEEYDPLDTSQSGGEYEEFPTS